MARGREPPVVLCSASRATEGKVAPSPSGITGGEKQEGTGPGCRVQRPSVPRAQGGRMVPTQARDDGNQSEGADGGHDPGDRPKAVSDTTQ